MGATKKSLITATLRNDLWSWIYYNNRESPEVGEMLNKAMRDFDEALRGHAQWQRIHSAMRELNRKIAAVGPETKCPEYILPDVLDNWKSVLSFLSKHIGTVYQERIPFDQAPRTP